MNLKTASALAIGLAAGPTLANAMTITPTFDASITSNANAAAIEAAVNSAIGTFEGLYSNPVTIPVTFMYTTLTGGFLAESATLLTSENYATYVSQLQADSAANPGNTVLATALANLAEGNDANGNSNMLLANPQLTMLGVPESGDAIVAINSNDSFAFSRPVPSTEYDAVGAIEHELDEVLGGGGAGSALNRCNTCGEFGALDLYRYSAPFTPSYSTSSSAYFSIDGGVTEIVGFSDISGFDYGDFNSGFEGPGQLIQDAISASGQDEAYTTSSPEFEMMEAIGWDPAPSVVTPEPGPMALFGAGLVALALFRAVRVPS